MLFGLPGVIDSGERGGQTSVVAPFVGAELDEPVQMWKIALGKGMLTGRCE
jgi:hypothetical protein